MNKKGFTLVELVATMVILGVILMVAVPSYNSYIEKSKEAKCNADKRAILDAAEAFSGDCIVKNYCASGAYLSTYVTNPGLDVGILVSNKFLNSDYSKYENVRIKITGTESSGITDYSYDIYNDDIAKFKALCK